MDAKQLHRDGWALGLRANKLRDYINEHMAEDTPAPAPEAPAEEEEEVGEEEEAPVAAKKKTKKKTKKKAG